jgi:hypothetical protein
MVRDIYIRFERTRPYHARHDANPSAVFDVSGNAVVSGNLTVDSTTLVVDASNNRVGIGLANPTVALDVNGYVKTNPIGFNLIRSSGEVTIGGNSIIPFSSSGYDTALVNYSNSMASSGYFTAPINGYYFFSASAYAWTSNQGFSMRINATSSTNGQFIAGAFSVTSSFPTISAYTYLTVGQTVSLWSKTNGVRISTSSGFGNNFSGYLVYAA